MDFVRPHIQAMQGYVPGEQPPPGKYIKLKADVVPAKLLNEAGIIGAASAAAYGGDLSVP